MNYVRGPNRSLCSGGCGRTVHRMNHNGNPEKLCQWCTAGKPPPEADPKLHTDMYLYRCLEEIHRRKELLKGAA